MIEDESIIGEEMAWAIFNREFNWSKPGSRFSFNVTPSDKPQSRTRELVDVAVKAGAAELCEPPNRSHSPKRKQKSQQSPAV